MNRLSTEKRAQIAGMIVEGNSVRSITRMTGVCQEAILKLLCDLGKPCADHHDNTVRGLRTRRVQCDEVWSFCYAKEKNVPIEKQGTGAGSVWLWTAIDADPKLMLSYLCGGRDAAWANQFMEDLASRVTTRIRITTDGHRAYAEAVEGAFRMDVDYAMLIKLYGAPSDNPDSRYSPAQCIGIRTGVVSGSPDPQHISTSYVENDTLRKALEIYLQQKRDKLKEVQELDLMISRLRRDLGDTAQEVQADEEEDSSETGLGETWREAEFGPAAVTAKAGTKANVRPDEFFGMTYTTAAAAYLERVGHAVSMDELLNALNQGGCPVGGKEPRKTLYISLIRAVKTFVPIPGKSGYLGLRKFYPNLKAAKEEKEDKQPKRKRRRRRRLQKKGATAEGLTVVRAKPGPKAKKEKPESSAKERGHLAADQTA